MNTILAFGAPGGAEVILLLLLLLSVLSIPAFIAFARNHRYKWVILVLAVFGSVFWGIGWLVALVWAVFPNQTTERGLKCRNCNTEVQSGEFCPNCGSKLG